MSGYNEIDTAALEFAKTKTKAEEVSDWIHGDLFYDVYVPFHLKEKEASSASGTNNKARKQPDHTSQIQEGSAAFLLCLIATMDPACMNRRRFWFWPHLFSYLTLPLFVRCKPSVILMTSSSYFSSQAFFRLVAHELNMINDRGLSIFYSSSQSIIGVSCVNVFQLFAINQC